MYNFGDKKNKKLFVKIIVGLLCLCMVVPMAYSLIALIFG